MIEKLEWASSRLECLMFITNTNAVAIGNFVSNT